MNALQKSLLVAGVLGLGSTIASPAFAQQAYASGSSTIVTMNGASQSLGAELATAAFYQIDGPVTVTPILVGGTLEVNELSFTNSPSFLGVGGQSSQAISPDASVEAAVAAKIDAATPTTLADGVSYTRAWRSGLQ